MVEDWMRLKAILGCFQLTKDHAIVKEFLNFGATQCEVFCNHVTSCGSRVLAMIKPMDWTCMVFAEECTRATLIFLHDACAGITSSAITMFQQLDFKFWSLQ